MNGLLEMICVWLTVRELSKVKHELEVALTEVLTNDEEPSGAARRRGREQEADGNLKQQLVDAEGKVPSSFQQKKSFSSAPAHVSAQLVERHSGPRTRPWGTPVALQALVGSFHCSSAGLFKNEAILHV